MNEQKKEFFFIKGHSVNEVKIDDDKKMFITSDIFSDEKSNRLTKRSLDIQEILVKESLNRNFQNYNEVYLFIYNSLLSNKKEKIEDIEDKDLEYLKRVVGILERSNLIVRIYLYKKNKVNKRLILNDDLTQLFKSMIIKKNYTLMCKKNIETNKINYKLIFHTAINEKACKEEKKDMVIYNLNMEDYLFFIAMQEFNLLKAFYVYIDLNKSYNKLLYREYDIYINFFEKLKKYHYMYEIMKEVEGGL